MFTDGGEKSARITDLLPLCLIDFFTMDVSIFVV
jgi:hypothetical protein